MKKISARHLALLALAVIGLACSIALTQHFYELRSGAAGFKSYCNIGSKMNCDAVAASTWAEALPGLPISSVAAGWYAGLFFIYLSALSFTVRREAMRVALILVGISTVCSLFLLYIMAVQLGTYCLFCLALDAVNFISLGILSSIIAQANRHGVHHGVHKGAQDETTRFPHWKSFLATMAVSIFIAVVGLKGLDTISAGSDSLKEQAEAVFAHDPVAVSSSPTDLSIGPANAPITIVEFSDFQCPYCRIGAFTLHGVMSRFPQQVRVVMKPYAFDPSCNRFIDHPMHPVACEAARAAVCAGDQGKFEPVYENFFQNQESLGPGKVIAFAQEAGLNASALTACMNSNGSLAKVQESIEEADRLKVNSTPTFFINGYRVEGIAALPFWTEVIKHLLVAAQSSPLHQ
jgi:protein-disulfide isomerase